MTQQQFPAVPVPARVRGLAAWLSGWLVAGLCSVAGDSHAQAPKASPVRAKPASEPEATSDAPVLRKLRTTGVITLGYRTASPPFSFLDAALQPIGYSIDLCAHVVQHLRTLPGLADLEVRRVAVSSSTRLPMVANGMVDLECASTTNTAERQRMVGFSVTTFVAESRLLFKRSTGIESLDDLRGRSVATTIGTTSVRYLQDANRQRSLGMSIMLGLDDVEAFQLVESGRADAFAMDDVLLKGVLASAPNPSDYAISSLSLSVEPYGLTLNRRDPHFKRAVDDALIGVYRSGAIHEIYRRWFQSPIPPRGVSLQLPMSEALQRAIRNPTDSPDPAHYR